MLGDLPVYPILLSTDMAASRAFYGATLGLELLSESAERLLFRCGDGTRLLISRSTVGTADSQTQVAWRVPDIRAAIADLRARGVRIEEYTPPEPETHDGVADVGHSWAAWFLDPSGNVLSIIEPKG
jgi:catechol 2,3-dioxygenase-like lactoylglutathione lyase family enzyme